MTPTVFLFLIFVAITLVITAIAAGSSQTSRGFYSAHRRISGWQNGFAVAGDYMSAASFLGITGLIAFYGFDGFTYSVGWLLAFGLLLLVVAEPLRNTGKYTISDVISFRNRGAGVRALAAISTLVITLLYMIAQFVGGGSLIVALIPKTSSTAAIVTVGVLIVLYVTIGGMIATTWVQIIKAVLLLGATIALSALVLHHYAFSLQAFFGAASHVVLPSGSVQNLLAPGLHYTGAIGRWDVLSLGLALILGTAGLPHILMRFYTVPSAKAARTSVAWAMVVVGIFFLLTLVLGLGAATLVGEAHIGAHLSAGDAIAYIARHPWESTQLNAQLAQYGYIVPSRNSNLAVLLLASRLGGEPFLAVIAAVTFATILAVVAGLTISASSAVAHDIWWTLVRKGKGDEHEQLRIARGTAIGVAILSIVCAVWLRGSNVAFLMGLAFAVAASANVPAIVLTLAWKRFNGAGTIAAMSAGLVTSLVLIAIGPHVMGRSALFPLSNPGIVSIPLAFFAAIVTTLLVRDRAAEELYAQLDVRANTGLGAEV